MEESKGTITTLHRPYSGIYRVHDAALYFRATTRPATVGTNVIDLAEWRTRRLDYVGPSSRELYSWIRHGLSRTELRNADRDDLVLGFPDLIRLRMIVIMRSRGLSFE